MAPLCPRVAAEMERGDGARRWKLSAPCKWLPVEWKSRAQTVESGCVESGPCNWHEFGQGISY